MSFDDPEFIRRFINRNKPTLAKPPESEEARARSAEKLKLSRAERIERIKLRRELHLGFRVASDLGDKMYLTHTPRTKEDYFNRRYGMLTAKFAAGHDSNGGLFVRCICDCGNVCNKRLTSLRSGSTNSCGCLVSPSIAGKYKDALSIKAPETSAIDSHAPELIEPVEKAQTESTIDNDLEYYQANCDPFIAGDFNREDYDWDSIAPQYRLQWFMGFTTPKLRARSAENQTQQNVNNQTNIITIDSRDAMAMFAAKLATPLTRRQRKPKGE